MKIDSRSPDHRRQVPFPSRRKSWIDVGLEGVHARVPLGPEEPHDEARHEGAGAPRERLLLPALGTEQSRVSLGAINAAGNGDWRIAKHQLTETTLEELAVASTRAMALIR